MFSFATSTTAAKSATVFCRIVKGTAGESAVIFPQFKEMLLAIDCTYAILTAVTSCNRQAN